MQAKHLDEQSSSGADDYNDQYSFESENGDANESSGGGAASSGSSELAAEIEALVTHRADETEPDQALSTPAPQSNLKGDTLTDLKHLLLHSTTLNRTMAEAAIKNYSQQILIVEESGPATTTSTKSTTTSSLLLNATHIMTKSNLKQKNVTTRGLYNTFVPTSDYQELCNYNTCQLGKCLPNGTCECVKPAVGKFCDQIDECLVLKCVNVSIFQLFIQSLLNHD